jgi:hypothetical protein
MESETLSYPDGCTCEDPERIRIESRSNSKLYELTSAKLVPYVKYKCSGLVMATVSAPAKVCK